MKILFSPPILKMIKLKSLYCSGYTYMVQYKLHIGKTEVIFNNDSPILFCILRIVHISLLTKFIIREG